MLVRQVNFDLDVSLSSTLAKLKKPERNGLGKSRNKGINSGQTGTWKISNAGCC